MDGKSLGEKKKNAFHRGFCWLMTVVFLFSVGCAPRLSRPETDAAAVEAERQAQLRHSLSLLLEREKEAMLYRTHEVPTKIRVTGSKDKNRPGALMVAADEELHAPDTSSAPSTSAPRFTPHPMRVL